LLFQSFTTPPPLLLPILLVYIVEAQSVSVPIAN